MNCKDCKHCVIDDDYDFPGKKSVEFKDCPISNWFEIVWQADTDFYGYGETCDFDTLQPPPDTLQPPPDTLQPPPDTLQPPPDTLRPPPNCNCFEPKEKS